MVLPQRSRAINDYKNAAGAVTAFALLLGAGVAYRVAAAGLSRSHRSTPLSRGTLAVLPLSIADWSGEDVALDDAVIEISDTDDHVNRVYSRSGGRQRVSLFVGYGVKMRDLMPHRPEVCYVGQGWTLLSTRYVELPMPDGKLLPCQVHSFQRGGLDPRRTSVLNYYIVDGRLVQDVSALRSQAWKFRSEISYVAQVQIANLDVSAGKPDDEEVRNFAAQSAGLIRGLLVDAVSRVANHSQDQSSVAPVRDP
jgi:EpsI family protein